MIGTLSMMIRLINPRGRVVEIDDQEQDIRRLLLNGFVKAPSGVEEEKNYNPVFDKKGKHTADPRALVDQSRRKAIGEILPLTEV